MSDNPYTPPGGGDSPSPSNEDGAIDDDAIRRMLAELDSMLHEATPRSHTTLGPPDSAVYVRANKAGLVSLAQAFLQAALNPPSIGLQETMPTGVGERHHQMLEEKDDVSFGWIQHEQVLPIPEEVELLRQRRSKNSDQLALIGCGIVGFVLLFLLGLAVSWINLLLDP